ncbi:MAG: MFS transporter, partial [Planktomarina sp.]
FFFHQVYFAETNTWTHLSFVALIPVYTCVSIGAMILSGMLLDRFGTAKLIPFFQLPMVVGFLCFATAQSLGGVAIGLFFIGLSSGANATLPNAFWAEFYGTKHLGAIKSAAAAAMVFGSAIGPYITGISIDSGIPLTTQYVWVSGYFIISSLCIWVGIRWASPLLSTAS